MCDRIASALEIRLLAFFHSWLRAFPGLAVRVVLALGVVVCNGDGVGDEY